MSYIPVETAGTSSKAVAGAGTGAAVARVVAGVVAGVAAVVVVGGFRVTGVQKPHEMRRQHVKRATLNPKRPKYPRNDNDKLRQCLIRWLPECQSSSSSEWLRFEI